MKALVYAGPKKAELRDVETGEKKEGQIKIDVTYCGVCGSDIGIYLGTHPRAKAPLVFGHEFLGVAAEDGKRIKKGDRVVPYCPADTAKRAETEMSMCAIRWG